MFLIDLLFPRFCLGCGYAGVYFCPSCLKRLKTTERDSCLYCKKPSLFGLTHPNCSKILGVDGLMTIYNYNPFFKKIINNIKYRLATDVWLEFCKTIKPQDIIKLSFYNKLSLDFVIQPIPLSKIKFSERGFNQAKIISKFFQNFLRFPIVDLLIREKEKIAQAQTRSKKERYLNVKGIFKTKKSVPDNIILIDDVITSGSTVKEAVKVLKRAGAKKIYVLALARSY